MSVDGLIPAYRVDTGEKVRIPAHWLDHPVLGKPFRPTPKASATKSANPAALAVPADDKPKPPRGRRTPTSADATPAPDLDNPTTPDAGEKE